MDLKELKIKNIKKYKGTPLLSHSIKHSLNLNIFKNNSKHRLKKYAEIAIKYGAEVPFLRPKKISKDRSTDLECFIHCLIF